MQYKVEFVRQRRGKAVAEELKREFAAEKLFPIFESRWYPFELYDRLLVRTADLCFDGDIRGLEDLSAEWAGKSLTGIYESYAWSQRLDIFLSRIPKLHDRMFTRGKLLVAKGEVPGQDLLTIAESDDFTEPALYSAAGFYVGAARFFGHPQATCTFERQGSNARFDLRR